MREISLLFHRIIRYYCAISDNGSKQKKMERKVILVNCKNTWHLVSSSFFFIRKKVSMLDSIQFAQTLKKVSNLLVALIINFSGRKVLGFRISGLKFPFYKSWLEQSIYAREIDEQIVDLSALPACKLFHFILLSLRSIK